MNRKSEGDVGYSCRKYRQLIERILEKISYPSVEMSNKETSIGKDVFLLNQNYVQGLNVRSNA